MATQTYNNAAVRGDTGFRLMQSSDAKSEGTTPVQGPRVLGFQLAVSDPCDPAVLEPFINTPLARAVVAEGRHQGQ